MQDQSENGEWRLILLDLNLPSFEPSNQCVDSQNSSFQINSSFCFCFVCLFVLLLFHRKHPLSRDHNVFLYMRVQTYPSRSEGCPLDLSLPSLEPSNQCVTVRIPSTRYTADFVFVLCLFASLFFIAISSQTSTLSRPSYICIHQITESDFNLSM